jgi:hypothetical protein
LKVCESRRFVDELKRPPIEQALSRPDLPPDVRAELQALAHTNGRG